MMVRLQMFEKRGIPFQMPNLNEGLDELAERMRSDKQSVIGLGMQIDQ